MKTTHRRRRFILNKKQIFQINRKSVLASRLVGKEHRSLSKLCSVIGLATPVSDVRFMEYMNFLETIALELTLKI